jgi:iron complex transport system substrate-binding protein
MILRPKRLLSAACLALLGSAAAAANSTDTADLATASRLVAVGGSVTEIIYALGEGDRLIARDTTSVYPEAALALPDVGYMRALSPEGVLSVDPDAIIALEGSGPPEAVEVLEKASVPVVTVPETFDRAGILAKIRVIGDAIGASGEAAKLASAVDAEIKAAESQAAASAQPVGVMFILSMQGGKALASGTGTAADGIIKMAGGRNVVSGFAGYRQLSDEAIVSAKPDVILMMDREGDAAASDRELAAHPAVGATPAARAGRVVRMDGSYLLGFGPRTAGAIRDLAAALHGGPASR